MPDEQAEHIVKLTTEEVRFLRQNAHLRMRQREKGTSAADRYWYPIARSAWEKLRAVVSDDEDEGADASSREERP